MKNLFVISGATGMTGSELSHQLIRRGDTVIGFDNFFASSIDTVSDILADPCFIFKEWDINNQDQMNQLKQLVLEMKPEYGQVIYINCAAVVHTEHFYEVEHTYTTNVVPCGHSSNKP